MLPLNELYQMDCMDGMKGFPDGYFDLAIVDPPYGINRFVHGETSRLRKYGSFVTANDWKPTPEYFTELFRVSKNQVVWGYNHLSDLLPPTTEFIFWFKHQPVTTYSDGELAWTSYSKTAKCFDYPYFGSVNADEERIHPTQKPVALYAWILKQYAQPGQKILDTHVGSASSLIACHRAGLEYIGFEINPAFYEKAKKRLDREKAQISLFGIGGIYKGGTGNE